jgi:hypothetical protein
MTMMGRIESCVGVLVDTLPKLGDGPVQQGDQDTLAFEVQILIPQPFMGTIIGTGGTKIKELRSKTRTSIKIFSEPMPNSNERSVQLIGTEEQITECVRYFLDEISKVCALVGCQLRVERSADVPCRTQVVWICPVGRRALSGHILTDI